MPSDPAKMLNRVYTQPSSTASKPRTPPENGDLDFSLLLSSPPDSTELYQSNIRLNRIFIKVPEIPEKAKRYIDRTTRILET